MCLITAKQGASAPGTATEERKVPAGSGLSLSSEAKSILTSSVPYVCHKTHRNQYGFRGHQALQNDPLASCNKHNSAAGGPTEGSGGCRGHDGCDKGGVIWELLRPGRIPKCRVSQETGMSSLMALVWSGKAVAGAAEAEGFC